MTNEKNLMTWSLRVTASDYRHDYEEYGNKITSIGLHEWDIDGAGSISMYKPLPLENKSNGIYLPGLLVDATTFDRYEKYSWGTYKNTLFPNYIEPDMKRWPHIQYYMQFVIFTPDVVTRILDSQTIQDTVITNMKTVVSRFRKDQNNVDLGYTGIEIDCEGSFSDDKWNPRTGDDDKLIAFFKRIKKEVIIDANPDFKMRINAHAMWGDGVPDYFRFHNYKLYANSVDEQGKQLFDEVQIMSYDFAWNGSAPGPSTPIWWLNDIAEWVKQCFDPAFNPSAKCTIKDVWIGGAGYGRRWPIYDDDTFGSSVTYRNLVEWQNGYYAHLGHDGNTMADQDFIPMNAFNDPNSDNQIMYPHMYDYFKARHMIMSDSLGQTTARLSEYNGIEYATAYSKNQHIEVTGLKGITGEQKTWQVDSTGKAILVNGDVVVIKPGSEPSHNLWKDMTKTKYNDLKWADPRRSESVTLELGGQSYTLQAYNTKRVEYAPVLVDGSPVCQLTGQPETVLTYKLNVAQAGTYKIGAIVSFPFYNQTKLNGAVGGSAFTIGSATLDDYFPMMFKGAHVWNLGSYNLVAGDNAITINGLGSQHGTVVFGFFACDDLTTEVIGGYMTASPTIKQYKKRDDSLAKLPNGLAFTSEVLQQQPRPAIMWEDFYRQFLTDKQVQGLNADGTPKERTYTNSGLQSTTYYKYAGEKDDIGGGTLLRKNADGGDECYGTFYNGFTQGYWEVIEDAEGVACAHFDGDNPLNPNARKSGQLCLNYNFKVMNISAEVQFSVVNGARAGIRFASTGPGDGFMFLVDYGTQRLYFGDEVGGVFTAKTSAPLGDHAVTPGDRLTMRVRVNQGQAKCSIGDLDNLLGLQTVSMQPGAMGFVTTQGQANLYMMSLGTTERWETLERFSLSYTNDLGQKVEQKLGEISRPGIERDSYGYLILSAFDEESTRELLSDGTRPEISLDYIFKPVYIPTFQGKKNITIKLIDAGMWYKMLYIGDAEGMSITYAGDNESFNKAMNIAVYDYGCKGIGLWVLGQADPRIFETLPDVVSWHPKPE